MQREIDRRTVTSVRDSTFRGANVGLVNVGGVRMVRKRGTTECEVLSRLPPHERLIACHGWYGDHEGRRWTLLEYLPWGDLESAMRDPLMRESFSPDQRVAFCRDACECLAHLHANGLVLRDLAMRNLLLCPPEPLGEGRTTSGPWRLKLIDVGWSVWGDQTGSIAPAGKPATAPWRVLAPESARTGAFSFRSDVWSLGILLYGLCTDKRPYDSVQDPDIQAAVSSGIGPAYPETSHLWSTSNAVLPGTSRLSSIASMCLRPDSADRPSAAEVFSLLQQCR